MGNKKVTDLFVINKNIFNFASLLKGVTMKQNNAYILLIGIILLAGVSGSEICA